MTMNFLHTKMVVEQGDLVEVVFQCNAVSGVNVMLLDDPNYQRYCTGLRFIYHGGGHFTRSPARVVPPHPDSWDVVVDLGGAPGTVQASVRIVKLAGPGEG